MRRRRFLQLAASASALPFSSRAAESLRPSPPSAWSPRKVVLGSEDLPPGGMIQNFTSPAEPLVAGAWRLWVSISGKAPFNIGIAEGVPGEKFRTRWAELSSGEPTDAPFSIGNLPADWRPKQPVHLRLKNGRHRLYFWAHGPGVVRYLAAESEDGRRYRVLEPGRGCIVHPADRTVGGAASVEAGLHRRAKRVAAPAPGEELAPASLIANDATNICQLPDGTFELYTAALLEVPKGDPRYMAHDNTPGWVRVIDRLRSDDGLHWTDRRRIITPDEKDPIDQQFYYLAVTPTGRGRIGMLGHYRVEAQTMDLEWCFSADGIKWERPAREPWVQRAAPGVLPDSYGIYTGSSLVQHEGRWHLFYTGFNEAHNHKDSHGPATHAVLHASIPSLWA